MLVKSVKDDNNQDKESKTETALNHTSDDGLNKKKKSKLIR